MKRTIVPWVVVLCFALLQQPLMAATLSGTVYSGGSPVANLTVQVKGRAETATTGNKGEYRLELPPGTHTLVVRGREFPVKVAEPATRLDIKL